MKYFFGATAVVLLLTNIVSAQTAKCPTCCNCTDTTIQCVGVNATSDIDDVINRVNQVSPFPNINLFSAFPRLQSLDLSSNEIKRFSCPPDECTSLNSVQHLSLAHNHFGPQFDVRSIRKQFANLAALNISFNDIEEISGGVFPESMQDLDVSHNSELKRINFSSFGPNSRLTTLIALGIHYEATIELKEQLVKATPLTSFRTSEVDHFGVAFEKCLEDGGCVFPSLKTLQVSEAGIDSSWNSVLALFPNLEYLDLSYNSIFDAAMFRLYTAKLTHLNLRGNYIEVFNSVDWKQPNLRYLNLGGNQVTIINRIVHFPKLETLILDNNQIFTLSSGVFAKLARLKILDLRHNALHNLRASQLPPSNNISLKLEGNSLKCDCEWMMKYHKGGSTCLKIVNCRLCFRNGGYRLFALEYGLLDTCYLDEEEYEAEDYETRPEVISDTSSYVETTTTTTATTDSTTYELTPKDSFSEVSPHWSAGSIVGVTLVVLVLLFLLIGKLCYKFRDQIREYWYRLF